MRKAATWKHRHGPASWKGLVVPLREVSVPTAGGALSEQALTNGARDRCVGLARRVSIRHKHPPIEPPNRAANRIEGKAAVVVVG